jgi:guanylate kinase
MTAPSEKFEIARRGLMLVLSSPSGAGKSTLTRRLVEDDSACSLSVSMTTRPQRPGEVHGVDYIFTTPEDFIKERDAGGLLEWAEVFGNLYGTPRPLVENMLSQGRDVIFDIDWQGTQQLHEKAARDLVRIFILPPSFSELEKRLRSRASDSEEVVAHRMRDATAEISHWAEYDYIIVNRVVDESLAAIKSILLAERLKRERQIGMAAFARSLHP